MTRREPTVWLSVGMYLVAARDTEFVATARTSGKRYKRTRSRRTRRRLSEPESK